MNKPSKKHWITFFIITLFNITSIITVFKIGSCIVFLNILLCVFLIHNYLQEPFQEYGLHFKKIHIQVISGIVLEFIILFLLYSNSVSIKLLPFLMRSFLKQFPSYLGALFYFFNTLLYAVSEEIVFRGFLLSFFQKLFKNSLMSIFLSALLFGLIHYPLGQNLHQIIYASISGIIYGYLRINEPDKFTLFSLSLAHSLHNIFVDLLI